MTTPTRRGANGIPFFRPAEWIDPTDEIFFDGLSVVELQIVGTPSTPYTVKRSFDNSTYVDAYAYDKDGVNSVTITAAGFYTIDGGCYVKLTGGAGSDVFYRAGA